MQTTHSKDQISPQNIPSPLPAFLLTRHWRDRPDGVELIFWAQSPLGSIRIVIQKQQAVCFVRSDEAHHFSDAQRKHLALRNMDDETVDALYFRHQRQLQQASIWASQNNIELFESDIKPHDRYLMERFITGGIEILGQAVKRNGYWEYVNPQLRAAEFKPELSYLSLDIETDGIDGEIISVALSNRTIELVLMQGQKDDWPEAENVEWHATEKTLLSSTFERIKELDPDLLIGWNLINFDIDYLERRAKYNHIRFDMGRGKEQATVLQAQQVGQVKIASIPGRVALDGIDNLKAAFWSFETFELGHVAHELLGKEKLIEANENKVAEIQRQFREDRASLAAYNLEDARLVEDIFDKTDLFDFIQQRAVMTGLSLGRQGGSVAAFDNLYLPRLHRAGMVANNIGARSYVQSSPGGYVMDSKPGLYENVLVLDFKSLYPSIIRTFLIDPLGLARPGEDPVPGFLEATFSRSESILPEIITELWKARDGAKATNNKPLSHAIKIIMNSFYGVLGTSGCRFYNPKLASSITRRGHEIIKKSRKVIEDSGFDVIYGDTDSVFVLLGPGYSEEEARTTGDNLARQLNQWWRQELRQEFQLESHLEIEFETHFIRFVMPTIRGTETGSKKRYSGYIRSNKGEFKVVFKGLESVRSDWTPLAQDFQRELYQRVFFNEPWKDFLKETISRLNSGELDNKLVYRKRLRQRLDAYTHSQPPHVKAAKKLGKETSWVSYVITMNGPEPVQKIESPIDYQHYIDKQLQPVADGLLHFIGEDFEKLTANQLDLF